MEGLSVFSNDFKNLIKNNTTTFQADSSDIQAIIKVECSKEINIESNQLRIVPTQLNTETCCANTEINKVHDEINQIEVAPSTTPEKFNNLTCSTCKAMFHNNIEQRRHYKLDWHRYNLKQKLQGKNPISEEAYNEQIDDLSSTSGESSESEEEEETLNTVATAQGKVFLKNEDGIIFSLYKCLLAVKKEEIKNDTLVQKLKGLNENKQWTVLMLGGGHFAGAVFKNDEPILHKTFHCYTVRAGQGGSQSSRDNKNGGSQPKSAGALLRRYNESALVQHVKDIVETWKTEISKSHLILYRASGPYNRSVLFGSKTPLLERSDSRLRTIPFSTKRATFTEVKRVYQQLTMVYSYGSLEDATEKVMRSRSPTKEVKKSKPSNVNRAKSREIVVREIPGRITPPDGVEIGNDGGPVEIPLSDREVLEEFGDSLTPAQRRKLKNKMKGSSKSNNQKSVRNRVENIHDNWEQESSQSDDEENEAEAASSETKNSKQPRKKKKPKKKKNQRLREQEEKRKQLLLDVLTNGTLETFQQVLNEQISQRLDAQEEETSEEPNKIEHMFSEVLDNDSNTFLHIAAANNRIDFISYLLENGANPCLKNKKQQTPYTSTQDKEIREIFKEFALENPDKYNYNKAQIPIPVVPTEEMAEKKRQLRKVKREKEKLKKKENAVRKQEEAEQDRFANLTDREKCALAAERRILNLGGKVTMRCFTCGIDMAGAVPFTYNEYKFCTVECLKAHRMKSTLVL